MTATAAPHPAQERYASWLARGTVLGFALLVGGFLAYTLGFVPAHVPVDQLPELWKLPAAQFLRETGMPSGWGWVDLAHRGDVMNLAGIAERASCSLPCLAAVVPAFHMRRDRIHVAICVLEIAVILLAASGVLVGKH